MTDVRHIQNAWTRQQLFNPDTLVLAGPNGIRITINPQPIPIAGEGSETEVLLPAPGTTIGGLACDNLLTQGLTNTPASILFPNTVDVFGAAVERLGASTFRILQSGRFYVGVGLHITQNVNNNVSRIWLIRNGVAAIPYFGTTINAKQQGDVDSLSFQGYLNFNTDDEVIVRATCSVSAGASLIALAASGEAPAVPTAAIQFIGYLRKAP